MPRLPGWLDPHRTFHAHSLLYLTGMLASSMREGETKSFKETEMDPDTFEVLLRFMYTDTVDDGAISARGEDLLRGAKFYVLHGLKMRCDREFDTRGVGCP